MEKVIYKIRRQKMFRAMITETDTTIIGDKAEVLAGLECYIDAVYEMRNARRHNKRKYINGNRTQ